MHPSEEIYCEKSNRLMDKTIVLGIIGGIAAVIANDVGSAGKTFASMLPVTKPAISEGILNFVSEKVWPQRFALGT